MPLEIAWVVGHWAKLPKCRSIGFLNPNTWYWYSRWRFARFWETTASDFLPRSPRRL